MPHLSLYPLPPQIPCTPMSSRVSFPGAPCTTPISAVGLSSESPGQVLGRTRTSDHTFHPGKGKAGVSLHWGQVHPLWPSADWPTSSFRRNQCVVGADPTLGPELLCVTLGLCISPRLRPAYLANALSEGQRNGANPESFSVLRVLSLV